MKNIRGIGDLCGYGIIFLTGEACGLNMRILCDVTARGKKIIEKYLGVEIILAKPWNSQTNGDKHIGSILLTHAVLEEVGIFALLESGCTEVWADKHGYLTGIEKTDDQEDVARWRQFAENKRCYSYRGTAGDRNQHVFSGRID